MCLREREPELSSSSRKLEGHRTRHHTNLCTCCIPYIGPSTVYLSQRSCSTPRECLCSVPDTNSTSFRSRCTRAICCVSYVDDVSAAGLAAGASTQHIIPHTLHDDVCTWYHTSRMIHTYLPRLQRAQTSWFLGWACYAWGSPRKHG